MVAELGRCWRGAILEYQNGALASKSRQAQAIELVMGNPGTQASRLLRGEWLGWASLDKSRQVGWRWLILVYKLLGYRIGLRVEASGLAMGNPRIQAHCMVAWLGKSGQVGWRWTTSFWTTGDI